MDYDLSTSQRLLQEAAWTFAERECPLSRTRRIVDGAGADVELSQAIADQGWIGLHLPERYGGLDLSTIELAVVAEQLGRGCVPGPFLASNWAATLLAAAGGSIMSPHDCDSFLSFSSRIVSNASTRSSIRVTP